MIERLKSIYLRFLILCPIGILLLICMQIFYINRFNQRTYSVEGSDASQETYLSLNTRKDSTSTWLKRGVEWNGQRVDLKAQTIDGVLYNRSGDLMDQWTLRLDIKDDCFINNAWCGKVEIHQFVGSKAQKVQTVDLRKYNLKDIELAYKYDGDLLIPLRKGDFVVYYPSKKDTEVPVEPGSELTMGVIFYYFDNIDFLDHSLNYTYHRKLTYGKMFYLIAGLCLLWVILLLQYWITEQIYKNAEKNLEVKKSALMCMSDIYYAIYIAQLETNKLIPVLEKRSGLLERPKEKSAEAQLRYLIEMDADEGYKDLLFVFCNFSTIPKRLRNRDSIACEYISKTFGWCSIRFFAMDRIDERTLDRVLVTIQIIDAEKRELREVEQRFNRAEKESRERAAFLGATSDEILYPLSLVSDYNQMIAKESTQASIEEYTSEIDRIVNILGQILESMIDYSELVNNQGKIGNERFSVQKLVSDIQNKTTEFLGKNALEIKYDISPELPEYLTGDVDKIRMVMVLLILDAIKRTSEGSIMISVFGRAFEDKGHLLFSIRDTGSDAISETRENIYTDIASAFLEKMGSSLHVVTTPGDGNEVYFELE